MAGSKRRTVKVALVATLLASAGAGTYYATTGGGAFAARLFGHSQLVAEEPSPTAAVDLTQSELDAVASAWAGDSSVKAAPIVGPSR